MVFARVCVNTLVERKERTAMIRRREKHLHYLTAAIVIAAFCWAILPMLILQEDYVFTIHDGLDSYAAWVQAVCDHHMWYRLLDPMPFLHGIEGKYVMLSYTLYDLLNCGLGFVKGQIATRIIAVFMGFFSMREMLKRLFPEADAFQKDMICLLAAAYAVTPVSPIRVLGYASLPLSVILFLSLREKDKFSWYTALAFVLPLLSSFQAVYIFVCAFWALFTIIDTVAKKKLNINLLVAFIGMCIVSILSHISIFMVLFTASESNRGLRLQEATGFNVSKFVNYLLHGIYFSSPLHGRVLLLLTGLGTVLVIVQYWKGERGLKNKTALAVLAFGWFFWIFSALIRTLQEGGLKTGLFFIDGYQWGESIALMRLIWYLMLAAILFSTLSNRLWRCVLYGAICLQMVNIAINPATYNDVYWTMTSLAGSQESTAITLREFYSSDLFDEIREDIGYDGQYAAAYGFHPAVLTYNGFNTLDGYVSVHSMQWQLQFREIIAPALQRYEDKQQYYDGWGGRMYLYGELPFQPTRDKNSEPAPLYIDTDAFVKYGGMYILSRAEISNAEALGLEFINDFDSEESLYHIYLYQAVEETENG